MLANIHNYKKRINAGKKIEQILIIQLKQRGVLIDCSTENDDMYEKIDAWIYIQNKKHSVQLKIRENGDDIIFEIMKDIDRCIIGRDFLCKAYYYLLVDSMGNAKLFRTDCIKKMINELVESVKLEYKYGKKFWKGMGWEIKITIDKATGNKKLMAYINPYLFQCDAIWHGIKLY